MSINKQMTCYMCDQAMTSREHVPPKCLFPEIKDSGGVDYRREMISVPSCDLHNSAKSKEDEFFLLYMAANAHANSIGSMHQDTKLSRILERTPHVLAMMMSTATPAVAKDPDGNFRETCTFHIDVERFMAQFDHIARGIFFHHFAKKATAKITIVPIEGLLADTKKANDFIRSTGVISKDLFDGFVKNGANPDVFYYQVAEGLSGTLVLASFFENVKLVFIYSKPKDRVASADSQAIDA